MNIYNRFILPLYNRIWEPLNFNSWRNKFFRVYNKYSEFIFFGLGLVCVAIMLYWVIKLAYAG